MVTTRDEAETAYQTLAAPYCERLTALPSCIISYSSGDVDSNGLLDGRGYAETTLGFTYEGEFCKGFPEGAGVMRWVDGYVVESIFECGAANGTGRLLWPNSDCYEGELVNGVRHGRGTFTSGNGRSMYEGEWARGKRNGVGKERFPDGSVYEGGWLEDQWHGHGVFFYGNGDCYEGNWVYGKRHGRGEMGWKRGTAQYVELYDGMWEAGLPCGQGRFTSITKLNSVAGLGDFPLTEVVARITPSNFVISLNTFINVYEGSFMNGEREGIGTAYYADGSRFEGRWEHGKKSGCGRFVTVVSAPFYATFVDDIPQNLPTLPVLETDSAVPSLYIEDLCGIADAAQSQVSSVQSILLRFNTWLRSLFFSSCNLHEGVAFITTPSTWWKHRLPCLLTLPQFLYLLNSAHILDGLVTVSTVIRCVEDIILAEQTENYTSTSPCFIAGWEERRKESEVNDVYALRAFLNYRQFVEALVRIAAVACVGPNLVTLDKKLSMLLEEKLKNCTSVAFLFPRTRTFAVDVELHLQSLRDRFRTLVELEYSYRRNGFLSVRNFIRFVKPFLVKQVLEPQDIICRLFPLRRFQPDISLLMVLPSGFNIPQSDLGCDLFAKASNENGRSDADLIAAFELTLEDFIEAVVQLALLSKEAVTVCDGGASLASIIQTEILSLPTYVM